MKIFAFWSRQFLPLRDDWFLRTLPPDMEPVLIETEADSPPGGDGFMSAAWKEAIDFRLWAMYDIIRQHEGELICVSDLDVQFFGSFQAELLVNLGTHDVAGMREWVQGGMNAGFMAIRCRKAVADLWEEVAMADKSRSLLYDQAPLNLLLQEQAHGVTHTLLPDEFWASHRHSLFHEPEPERVLVHHATGCPDKFGELRRVRERYGG